MNVVVAIGNLGDDAELRYTNSGVALAKFSVADNRKFRGDEKTTCWNCAYFGKGAEAVHQYLKKGKTVAVTGFLEEDRWEDKEGNRRISYELIVKELKLLGSKGEKKGDETFEDDVPF